MKRLIIACLLVALVVISCSLIWPERFAINAPVAHLLWGRGGGTPDAVTLEARFHPPAGFGVQLWAEELPNVRWMKPTPLGNLLVSLPRAGEIKLVRGDEDGDSRADGVDDLLDGLNRPHGIELVGDWLYVAETDAIGRIRFDDATRTVSGPFERILTGLPGGGNHWSRTIRLGPDGWLYLSVGSSCNVCDEEDDRRAAILRLRPDGSSVETYATGLRNSVGFDWRPGTPQLFATDNGRDLLGDDFPPCELNRIVEGGFYGWPIANGDRIADPDFGAGQAERIAASIPPEHAFRAHNAPLGITFVRGARAPRAYRGAALVALHGSWNRTHKDGYKVVSLHWQPDGSIVERDFLSGFLMDEDVIGRPVDVVEAADGAFFVSDDYAGVIYRVAQGAANTAHATHRRAALSSDPLAAIPAAERGASSRRGEALWSEHACAGCHVAEQAAQGVVVRTLGGLASHYDVAALVSYLKTPIPPMPIVPLDEQAQRDVAVYLLSRFP